MLPDASTARKSCDVVNRSLFPPPYQPVRAADVLPPFRALQGDVMRVHRRAVGQEDPQAQAVIPRLAILHAAKSRGVVPVLTADPAQILASGVGSESHSALARTRCRSGEDVALLYR